MTNSRRLLTDRLQLQVRWWARNTICATVLLLALGCSGPQQVEPEVQIVLDGSFAGGVEVDGDLWVLVNRMSGRQHDGAYLQLIGEDGSVSRRMEVSDYRVHFGVVYEEGLFWVRRDFRREPGSWENEEIFPIWVGMDQLVGIDPSDGAPARTHWIQRQHFVDPISILDGKFWEHQPGDGHYIELETGNSVSASNGDLGDGEFRGTVLSTHLEGDHLWVVRSWMLAEIEVATGEFVQVHYLVENPTIEWAGLWVPGGFKHHAGSFWVPGYVIGLSEDEAYEYDLSTRTFSSPVQPEKLPSRSFEAGGSRWELYNNLWHSPRDADAFEADRWRRVDLETGREIGEYDFGEYQPEFVADGHLWLSRKIGGGNRSELARLPLS